MRYRPFSWIRSRVGLAALLLVGAMAAPAALADPRNLDRPAHHLARGFRNLDPAYDYTVLGRTLSLLRRAVQPQPDRGAVPAVVRNDGAELRANGTRPTVTWVGHATLLVQLDGVNILTDPNWNDHAGPLGFGPRRLVQPGLRFEDLPPIHAVVISHDHYDHLDMATVQALASAPRQAALRFIVPLGIGAHLERWGVPRQRIAELDWEDSAGVGGLTVTAMPARHFSGRWITGGNRTLWATWVITGPGHRIFHSGDTGFFDGFATIGERFGPFDLAMIKVGSYDEMWPDIHVNPEEAVRAHGMLRSRLLLPIHWGTFNMAFHDWFEPADRVLAAARASGTALVMPRPGERVEPATPLPVETWWRLGRDE